MNLLHIDSSVRVAASQSRKLANQFVGLWKQSNAQATITYRDVNANPPPHPTEAYTVANYTPADLRTDAMKLALADSDALIDELIAANMIVFSIPMYNFSIPSTFKAYIDNLVRVGRTFNVGADGQFVGLLKGKKVIIITTRGAMYGQGSPIAALDYQEPYLRTVLGFMGLDQICFVNADGMDFGTAQYKAASLETAAKDLKELAQS